MMFWDGSAIVPLLMRDETTRGVEGLLSGDSSMLVWWATEVECASAIARLERDGAIAELGATTAFARLRHFADRWHEVDPSDAVREAAIRFMRVHPLRAADALQLAAAFIAADRRPASLSLVTLDERLAGAARREGFTVIEIAAA